MEISFYSTALPARLNSFPTNEVVIGLFDISGRCVLLLLCFCQYGRIKISCPSLSKGHSPAELSQIRAFLWLLTSATNALVFLVLLKLFAVVSHIQIVISHENTACYKYYYQFIYKLRIHLSQNSSSCMHIYNVMLVVVTCVMNFRPANFAVMIIHLQKCILL